MPSHYKWNKVLGEHDFTIQCHFFFQLIKEVTNDFPHLSSCFSSTFLMCVWTFDTALQRDAFVTKVHISGERYSSTMATHGRWSWERNRGNQRTKSILTLPDFGREGSLRMVVQRRQEVDSKVLTQVALSLGGRKQILLLALGNYMLGVQQKLGVYWA